MPKLPVVKPREAIKAIRKCGFVLDHTTGSHYTFYNSDKSRRVSIAYHNKSLKRKTLSSIIEQAGLTVEEFKELL
jgi:predicted RNA binding protein YcfA (HicA-like mRNA interferase family)